MDSIEFLSVFIVDKMATGGYFIYMESIKTVGIKRLRDNLSSYLRDVKSGITILITDRDDVIAELHKPTIPVKILKNESVQSHWIKEGKLISPKSLKKKILPSPVKKNEGTTKMILDLDRGE